MKASELRIGIWVYLFGDAIQLTKEHLIYLLNKDSLPEPITLTEEWLLKFGFEEGRNHAGWVLLKDPAKGDYIDDNVLFEFFEGAYDHIKYVHQLQNLYFALTGEELTVKQ